VALALARSGARRMTIVDPDRFDRTNTNRQLVFGSDLGRPKAIALAQNLLDHMVAGGQVTAIPLAFDEAVQKFPLPANVVLFLVDNNRCRFQGVGFARQRHIPAVFTMLSADGSRLHTFLQGPARDDPCLWCALPNLDVAASAPCASATITSCLLGAAYTTFFAHRAVMGWPPHVAQFNWREADLLGVAPDRVGTVARRPGCATCSIL
jgi:molybdopterin/thiamine biosynthesis adenylyltransferase